MAKKTKKTGAGQSVMGFSVPNTKPITVVAQVHTKKEIQKQKRLDKLRQT